MGTPRPVGSKSDDHATFSEERGAHREEAPPSVWALCRSLARLWRVHLALMALALFCPRALDD